MLLHTFPSHFLVEHKPQSLRIDRQTGKVSLLKSSSSEDTATAFTDRIFGLVGCVRLLRGRYLVVITNAKEAATIRGHKVLQATHFKIIPFSTRKVYQDLPGGRASEELRYQRYLNDALQRSRMYFSQSPEFDITRNQQSQFEQSSNDPDARFWWNRRISEDDFNFGAQPSVRAFCPILMDGFITSHQVTINQKSCQFSLVSRRGCDRVGARYTCRGLDQRGNAANFVETEQILEFHKSDQEAHCVAFVETRGSMPFLWEQPVNIKYMPSGVLTEPISSEASQNAFRRHFADQCANYGRQILVNLVDQKGMQGSLEAAYAEAVDLAKNSDLRYVPFDFHHECRKMQWQNLSKLVAQVSDEFGPMLFFHEIVTGQGAKAISKVQSRQSAVFRVNCMDNLDRTNVVQGLLARTLLKRQLETIGVDPEATSRDGDEFADASFENVYKNVWADNADAMSIQYSGTPALKTDFTRTGRRTRQGVLADGWNSARRYYLNNFRDGQRQDSLDLLVGNHVPHVDNSNPFRGHDDNKLLMMLAKLVVGALVLALFAVALLSYSRVADFRFLNLVGLVILFFVLLIKTFVVSKGRDFCDVPLLQAAGHKRHTKTD